MRQAEANAKIAREWREIWQNQDEYNENVELFHFFEAKFQQKHSESGAAKENERDGEKEKAKSAGKKRAIKGSKIAAQRGGVVEPVAVPRMKVETGGRTPAGPSTAASGFSRLVEDMEEDDRNRKWEEGEAENTRGEVKAKSSVVYRSRSDN